MFYVRFILIAFVISLLSIQGAMAAEKVSGAKRGKVMLVLDASGSMRGKISGKSKMQIAREVIRDLM